MHLRAISRPASAATARVLDQDVIFCYHLQGMMVPARPLKSLPRRSPSQEPWMADGPCVAADVTVVAVRSGTGSMQGMQEL